jgi:hypothetical protein
MAAIASIHTDRLKELRDRVEEAQEYFQDNVKRYEKFMNFVFKTSLRSNEEQSLSDSGKPTIEFNILESYISRQRGEFAKQEPSLQVRAADGVPLPMLNKEFSETLDTIEAHLRAIFFDGSNDMLEYNIYSDLLAGGFSALRVFTEYVNEKSFEQNIMVERVFDPTLTVFDCLARQSHKGDGKFCAEIYPMTREQFETEFGKEATENMKFTRNLSGFNWSFKNEQQDIVLVCDYYEKKSKKETILKLSNGHSITKREYERFLKVWEESGNIEQPPLPVNERKTTFEHIVRYRFCESKILDYVETNYKYLPLVFVDGNSVVLRESGSYTQMTRPYIYHAEGIQRLKNFAGQSLAKELEDTISHKFMIPIESIPSDASYQEAYRNVQKADVLVYNHFLDTNNPQVTLPPPQVIARTPIPPEITNTFKMSDEMTQTILGNYDSAQGVNQAQLSGIAFARSAIQSNNASVPYIVGYIKGLNRVAQIVVDLIPKYYRTPRSLPILLPDGKRSYKEINKKGSLYMNFDPNHLEVKVSTGVNFAMQKEIALQTIIAMSQANQGFAQFFNEEGLPVILDNLDIRGIDQLKEKANSWMQKQKQQQAQQIQMQQQQSQMQAQQQAMQMAQMQKELQSPSQTQVEQMFIQQKAQVDSANIAIKAKDSETKFLETLSKIRNADMDGELKAAKLEAENERSAVESLLEISEHINRTIGEAQNERETTKEMDSGP